MIIKLCRFTHIHPSFTQTDLGNEHQAERDGAAEDDDQSHDAELDVGLVPGQEGHRSPDDAHDAHVVHTHPDVLAVVESWDAHVPGLPGQEAAEQLSGGERKRKRKRTTCGEMRSQGSA